MTFWLAYWSNAQTVFITTAIILTIAAVLAVLAVIFYAAAEDEEAASRVVALLVIKWCLPAAFVAALIASLPTSSDLRQVQRDASVVYSEKKP